MSIEVFDQRRNLSIKRRIAERQLAVDSSAPPQAGTTPV
jgi:hypothetical protein